MGAAVLLAPARLELERLAQGCAVTRAPR